MASEHAERFARKHVEGARIQAWHYLAALLLASALFSLVFLAAYTVSYLNYEETVREQNVIRAYIADLEQLQQQPFCTERYLYEASEKLTQVGARLSLLESRFGKRDARVLEQKKLYSTLESQHFLIVQALNTQCGGNFVLILFFYSNEESDEDESERIGFVLSTLKNAHPERAMVYSFDFYLEDVVVEGLKERYDVGKAPLVVVGSERVEHPGSIDAFQQYFAPY